MDIGVPQQEAVVGNSEIQKLKGRLGLHQHNDTKASEAE